MQELKPEIVKIAKNFMLFVESVRNEFRIEKPMDYLVGKTDEASSLALRKGWEKAAQVWPAIESPDNYFVTIYTLLESIEVAKTQEKWLSIGAGPALYEIWLSKIAAMDFYVSDFSYEMCRLAKMIYNGAQVVSGSKVKGGKIFPMVSDMENIGFRDRVFDQIISINALHWVPNWRQTLKEMRRVIKTDGLGHIYLVVSGATPKVEDADGTKHPMSDISQELIFDELEKLQFEIIFSRIILVKEGQLGKQAQRFFIKARLNLKRFDSWRKKSMKMSAYGMK